MRSSRWYRYPAVLALVAFELEGEDENEDEKQMEVLSARSLVF